MIYNPVRQVHDGDRRQLRCYPAGMRGHNIALMLATNRADSRDEWLFQVARANPSWVAFEFPRTRRGKLLFLFPPDEPMEETNEEV